MVINGGMTQYASILRIMRARLSLSEKGVTVMERKKNGINFVGLNWNATPEVQV